MLDQHEPQGRLQSTLAQILYVSGTVVDGKEIPLIDFFFHDGSRERALPLYAITCALYHFHTPQTSHSL